MSGSRPRMQQRRSVRLAVVILAAVPPVLARAVDTPPPAATAPVAFVGEMPIDRAAIDVVLRRLNPATKPSVEQRMQLEASVLEQLIDGRWPLRYIGRVRNSSPSEGFATWHAANQRAIVEGVFDQKAEAKTLDRVLSRQV